MQGLDAHGKDWKQIHKMLTTRSLGQIRSHAQKYFQKVEQAKRSGRLGDGAFQLLMDGKRMVFSRGGRRPTGASNALVQEAGGSRDKGRANGCDESAGAGVTGSLPSPCASSISSLTSLASESSRTSTPSPVSLASQRTLSDATVSSCTTTPSLPFPPDEASDLEGNPRHQDKESNLAEHQTDRPFDRLSQNMHNAVPFLEPRHRHEQQQHQHPDHWQQQQCPSSPSSTCCAPRGSVWRTMAGKGWLPDTSPVSSIEEETDAVVKSEREHVDWSWGGREGGAREEGNEDEVEDALAMDFLRATSHLFPLEELRSFVTGVASDVGSHREDGTCPAPHAMAMDELLALSPGPTIPAGCCPGNDGNVQGTNWGWTGTGASVPADTDPLTVGPLTSSCAVASDDASHRGKSESFPRPTGS